MHRFGEDGVGAGFDAGFGAVNGGFEAFFLERIGAGDDEEVIVLASVNRGFDAINPFVFGNDFLVRTMAATLLGNLIFDVTRSRAGTFHFTDGAGNVECAAPAGVDRSEALTSELQSLETLVCRLLLEIIIA